MGIISRDDYFFHSLFIKLATFSSNFNYSWDIFFSRKLRASEVRGKIWVMEDHVYNEKDNTKWGKTIFLKKNKTFHVWHGICLNFSWQTNIMKNDKTWNYNRENIADLIFAGIPNIQEDYLKHLRVTGGQWARKMYNICS